MVVSDATRVRTRDRVIELRPPQSILSRGGTNASHGMRRSSYRPPVGRRSAGGANRRRPLHPSSRLCVGRPNRACPTTSSWSEPTARSSSRGASLPRDRGQCVRTQICRTFLHVVRVRKHTAMRESHAKRVQFSHVRVFSDLRNVQKSVTRIIYLRPLPSGQTSLAPFKFGIEAPRLQPPRAVVPPAGRAGPHSIDRFATADNCQPLHAPHTGRFCPHNYSPAAVWTDAFPVSWDDET